MATRDVTILLVEDNAGDALLIQEYLADVTALNPEMTHVTRLSQAFEHLSTTEFDVVLLDLGLPDSSGIESVTRIIDKAGRAAVVVLSGRRDDVMVSPALQAGAQDYLAKDDVSSGTLARAIGNAIERQAMVLERDARARISRIVGATFDISSILDRLVSELSRMLRVDRLVIARLDESAQTVTNVQVWGVPIPYWDDSPVRPLHASGAKWAIDTKRGHIGFPDGDRDPGRSANEKAGLLSVMFAPLISNNEVFGTLIVGAIEEEAYTDRDLTLLEGIADQIAGPINAANLYDQALMGAREREQRILVEAEKREIERISEAKSEFISTVSHELKTPLTCISAFIDILARNRSNNLVDRQLEQLGVMRRNSQLLNLLISDLLDVSRIDSRRFKLLLKPFDARSMLGDLVENFRPILDAKGQTLVVENLDEAIWLRADQPRIVQVLNNLLSNACKYSKAGATIHLVARATEQKVEFAVEDNGIGIEAGDLDQLFTMFFRSDNVETRSVAGMGLGLAIARTIVDLHGGEIQVQSEIGVGTRLSFYVPGIIEASVANSELSQEASSVAFRSRLADIDTEFPTATRPAA